MHLDPQRLQEEQLDNSVSLEPLSRVLVHNDEITPYDFVIVTLARFFDLDVHRAELITWTAHNSGLALVAILPLDAARRKVGKAHFAASLEGYPLLFTIEQE